MLLVGSDRTNTLFEAIDPEAFLFVRCEMTIPEGIWDGPSHWLCEVVRILDAVDESKSRLEIGIRDDERYSDHGKKFYRVSLDTKLVFKEEVIGNAHVFRMAQAKGEIICDNVLRMPASRLA